MLAFLLSLLGVVGRDDLREEAREEVCSEDTSLQKTLFNLLVFNLDAEEEAAEADDNLIGDKFVGGGTFNVDDVDSGGGEMP